MSKDEAIKAMMEGKKITHRHFEKDECMTVKDGAITFEDGNHCALNRFWSRSTRAGDAWDTGYSIFK